MSQGCSLGFCSPPQQDLCQHSGQAASESWGSSRDLAQPPSPLPAPSYREGVDEDPQEEQQNEEHDGQDEHPLVPPPQDVLQGLVGGGEPQEGGLWAPAAK